MSRLQHIFSIEMSRKLGIFGGTIRLGKKTLGVFHCSRVIFCTVVYAVISQVSGEGAAFLLLKADLNGKTLIICFV